MNITNRQETLLSQLRKIIMTMHTSGRKPLRIHLTYAQLLALQTELEAMYRTRIHLGQMELLGIPIQLTPPGSGLWVSCVTDREAK